MADYRDLAAALGGGYGQDTGPITPDTLLTLKNGKTASAGDLLGMLKGFGQSVGSNLESLGRGGVASVIGAGGDLETFGRMGINKLYGAGGVNVNPNPVLPTTIDILGMMPRTTVARPETAGMEELGGFMAPATAKLARKAIKATEGLPVGFGIKDVSKGFDPKKMGKQYPDTLPGVPMVDPKTNKVYIGKVLSPEAEVVQKFKKAAQKDIEKGNYTPYFDVEKRYYADPTRHPLQGNTLTDAIAKKPETIARWEAQLDTPEGRVRLLDAYNKGKQDPMTKDWYAMGQLENEFIKEFGLEKGAQMFKERFADAMAATTGGADPTSNLLTAAFGNYMRQNKKMLPENTYDLPFPIGGRFIGGNIKMYDKAINQGAGLTAAEQPKRFDFSGNFLGYKDKATIDEQMSQGFQPGLMAPPQGAYGVMENVIHDLAKGQGIDPVNFQDVTWAGLKNVPGKPMIQHVNEAIERTARITGKTPEQVVKDSLVKGTSPLFGAAPLGLLYDQKEKNQLDNSFFNN